MAKWTKEGCFPEYHIRGTYFSPKVLKEKFPELIYDEGFHESTDISTRGRRKGLKFKYGSCQILVPENEIYPIHFLCDFILENRSILDKMKIEDELICIYWIGRQGNMEFITEQLKKLSLVNIPVAMNYIYASKLGIE